MVTKGLNFLLSVIFKHFLLLNRAGASCNRLNTPFPFRGRQGWGMFHLLKRRIRFTEPGLQLGALNEFSMVVWNGFEFQVSHRKVMP